MMQMTNENFDPIYIATKAYQSLIASRVSGFPVHPQDFTGKRIRAVSFQKYSQLSSVPVETLKDETLRDGYTMRNIRPGITLILYDEDALIWRARFTLFHELGHIALNHTKHGKEEERAANYYASQVMAPDFILGKMQESGITLSPELLTACFGLSRSAAWIKLENYGSHPFIARPDLDQQIFGQFFVYLQLSFTTRPRCIDIYKDEAEENTRGI